MLFGYISTFFVAVLLSLFYVGYAVSGAVEQIKKDIKEEKYANIEIENSTTTFYVDYYVAEIPQIKFRQKFAKFKVPVIFADIYVSIKKIYLSDNFQRPPPCLLG